MVNLFVKRDNSSYYFVIIGYLFCILFWSIRGRRGCILINIGDVDYIDLYGGALSLLALRLLLLLSLSVNNKNFCRKCGSVVIY